MLTWIIYPPNFDPAKKYPTILYCQGGPQGALKPDIFFKMELSVDGCKRLYYCCAKQKRNARLWRGME